MGLTHISRIQWLFQDNLGKSLFSMEEKNLFFFHGGVFLRLEFSL